MTGAVVGTGAADVGTAEVGAGAFATTAGSVGAGADVLSGAGALSEVVAPELLHAASTTRVLASTPNQRLEEGIRTG